MLEQLRRAARRILCGLLTSPIVSRQKQVLLARLSRSAYQPSPAREQASLPAQAAGLVRAHGLCLPAVPGAGPLGPSVSDLGPSLFRQPLLGSCLASLRDSSPRAVSIYLRDQLSLQPSRSGCGSACDLSRRSGCHRSGLRPSGLGLRPRLVRVSRDPQIRSFLRPRSWSLTSDRGLRVCLRADPLCSRPHRPNIARICDARRLHSQAREAAAGAPAAFWRADLSLEPVLRAAHRSKLEETGIESRQKAARKTCAVC